MCVLYCLSICVCVSACVSVSLCIALHHSLVPIYVTIPASSFWQSLHFLFQYTQVFKPFDTNSTIHALQILKRPGKKHTYTHTHTHTHTYKYLSTHITRRYTDRYIRTDICIQTHTYTC